ncbi:hypothetical protein AtEden1_Chr5g0155051 [Arabidopsis thaliana]
MEFCGCLSELMNGESSSKRNGPSTLPVKEVRTDMRSKYSSDLSSYTSACKKTPTSNPLILRFTNEPT